MAGLGNVAAGGGMTPAGAEPDEMEDGEAASPEEQEAYDQFVNSALDVVYPKGSSGTVSPQILDDLRGNFDPKVAGLFEAADPPLNGTPPDNVAVMTVMLTLITDGQLGFLAKAREQQGTAGAPPPQPGAPAPAPATAPAPAQEDAAGPVDYDSVVMHAARAIAEELIEVSEAAKLHDFSEEDLETVWARAMDLYRTAAETMGAPGYDKDGLTNAFAELIQADKAGNLGSILPGLPGGAPAAQKGA